ncbi:DUF115 domain-containing protein [Helicobacter cholecystus]|uniref:DUF115 domain-containing protein n=1 Tax=Helicobacter cholecystus TaxID=45498 RepID=A0A3D8ISG3_9HELI|nr:6-hydroxymethylpterin diphosphokinase MptE-like protein [Helicobacter cholecystus]RDU68227.1 DUF115 domain-containing protein [Helicobacter cholecystus]VEJ24475.1 Uncharacterized protein conserved in bacteria [Helicobacter cholecystus]
MRTLSHILKYGSQQEIEQEISSRFIRNLEFFSIQNQKLYQELIAPPQNYNLFFDHRGINIIHLVEKSFVYPYVDNQSSMLEVHLDLANSPLNHPKWKINNNSLFLRTMDIDTFPITAQACNKMIKVLDEMGGVGEFHLSSDFLPSTTLFGCLGGLFLEFLREEGKYFHSLLFFEEEMDFFRISCYFIDYEALFAQVSPHSCYLFVQNLISKDIIAHYFETHKITNNFLRLELSLYDSPKIAAAKTLVYECYAQNARGWGSFEDESKGFANTLKNLAYPILQKPKRLDMPICVVGNGASLNHLIPFIKENISKMIIFSCGTALKVLKIHGISPDFQIEIERIDYLKSVLEEAPLDDTPLICGNMVNPNAIALAKEAYLFMRGGSGSSYLLDHSFVLELSSPFVGNAGVALASAFGSDVILCGLDCGYIEGESKHAQGSYYGVEGKEIPQDAFEVRGNQDKRVFSTSLYSLSAKMMALAISYYKPKTAINLGSGAYIEGSLSAKMGDFELKSKDKRRAIAQLKASFIPQNSDFSLNAYSQEMRDFLQVIKAELNKPLKSKKELFERIDKINHLCFSCSASHPKIGVMIEGSVYHLLQTLMMCSLHYPHNDLSSLYSQCTKFISEALDKCVMKCSLMAIT